MRKLECGMRIAELGSQNAEVASRRAWFRCKASTLVKVPDQFYQSGEKQTAIEKFEIRKSKFEFYIHGRLP